MKPKCVCEVEKCSCHEIYVLATNTNARGSKTNEKCEYRLDFGGNPPKKASLGFGYIEKRFGKERKTSNFFQKKIKKVLTNEKKALY